MRSAPQGRPYAMESSTRSASRLLPAPVLSMVGPQRVQPAGIVGLGSYAPERVLTNQDLERMVETSSEWIVTRTGILERRIADPSEKCSDLATRAAERALYDAGLEGS